MRSVGNCERFDSLVIESRLPRFYEKGSLGEVDSCEDVPDRYSLPICDFSHSGWVRWNFLSPLVVEYRIDSSCAGGEPDPGQGKKHQPILSAVFVG